MTAPSRSGHTSASGGSHRPHPAIGLDAVRRAIADSCARVDRDPGSVTVVAASKTVPAEAIGQAIEAGHRAFGENRVQEGRTKWPALRERHPDVELHLLGPLQSNKVRDAVALFDVIHSIGRPGICQALARECARQSHYPELFIQVNTGAEAQKAGVGVDAVESLLTACRQTGDLKVVGLMCIPPMDEPPAPHFALLARIAADHGLGGLSMGMSNDFAAAIECGATHVRVGSAIFGSRS